MCVEWMYGVIWGYLYETHPLFLAVGCVIRWTYFTFRSWLSDMIGGREFFQLLLSGLGSVHVLVPVQLSLLEKASGLLKWPGALPASLPGRSVSFTQTFMGCVPGCWSRAEQRGVETTTVQVTPCRVDICWPSAGWEGCR